MRESMVLRKLLPRILKQRENLPNKKKANQESLVRKNQLVKSLLLVNTRLLLQLAASHQANLELSKSLSTLKEPSSTRPPSLSTLLTETLLTTQMASNLRYVLSHLSQELTPKISTKSSRNKLSSLHLIPN
jgi:hypothetical protein